MRQAYNAGKSCDWAKYWEIFMGNGKFSVWISARVRERYNEVEQEEEGRLSIVYRISCGRARTS